MCPKNHIYKRHFNQTLNRLSDTGSYSDQKETHFGYESVKESEKAEKVYGVFQNVAAKYDLMNDVMSLGVHRCWKDYFVNKLKPVPGTKLLDVAGGTGDIAFRVLNYLKTLETDSAGLKRETEFPELENQFYKEPKGHFSSLNTSSHIVVSDINQHMLDVGMEKAKQLNYEKGISWLCADAEHLPIEDKTFDAYTIAFGIRNVVHIDKVLREAWRVLKPGGRFLCLEFSHVKNPAFNWLYHNYSFQVIPVLGQVLAQDWKSYQYLVESIRKFPEQEEFCDSIRSAGFSLVNYENLNVGLVAIHSGFKL